MNQHGLGNNQRYVSRVLLRLTCVATLVAIHTQCLSAQTGDSNDQANVAAEVPIESAVSSAPLTDRLPQVRNGRWLLPDLAAPITATDQIGNGRMPEGFRGGEEMPLEVLPEDATGRGDPANWIVSSWAAPNTFSNPRYYEDRMLERHGQERFPMLTPMTSGVRFFATAPMLPYLMTLRPACDCEYTLGYYRAGSCAPVMLQRPPFERRAVVAEGAAVAAAIIAFP